MLQNVATNLLSETPFSFNEVRWAKYGRHTIGQFKNDHFAIASASSTSAAFDFVQATFDRLLATSNGAILLGQWRPFQISLLVPLGWLPAGEQKSVGACVCKELQKQIYQPKLHRQERHRADGDDAFTGFLAEE
jgi:hypothetical protein